MNSIRPLKVQVVAVVCLIPTMIKDIARAIPEAITDFAHEVKDEMNERKKMADMLFPE